MRSRLGFLGDLNGSNLRDEMGRYKWPIENGAEFMSVTSILSVLNKPALYKWYASQEREYIATRIEAVYRGEIKGRELLQELRTTKGWRAHAETFRNERADLGTAVHHWVTRYVLNREAGIPPELSHVPSLCARHMESFHRWFEAECPQYIFVEGPVFNMGRGYAGTSDALIELKDGRFIIDYKISAQTVKDHALQIAAYRKADFIGIKSTGQEIPMPPTVGGKILLIHEDGCKLHDHVCGEREYEVFLHAMEAHKWRNSEYVQPKEEMR